MNSITKIISSIESNYTNSAVPTGVILSVLGMVFVLALYEFIVYRLVSKRAFFNRSFNISICVLPFFIATIILCLQSNLVITLGTIGALAIIRYRTAVKDPVDMLYILWSVHTGIVCGCQLYEVGVLTSLVVTVILLLFERLNFGRRPCVLIAHSDESDEAGLTAALKETAKSFKFKSRSYTQNGADYAVEFTAKDTQPLTDRLNAMPTVSRFSVIDYDAEDLM